MKKILLAGLATGLGLMFFAGSAYAISSARYISGTTNITPEIATYTTTGATMGSMLVTATFADGSQTETWASDVDYAGNWGVSGRDSDTDWILYQSNNTMTNSWTFSGPSNIQRLKIDAGPGKTVFDVWGSDVGTLGSSNGKAFMLDGTSPWDLDVTYSGLVALSGHDPVGDLYRYLSIDFISYNSGTSSSDTFSFFADTDNTKGDITPVPEPATMLLLGTGLAGLATLRRRKKNA